jgi:RNA polymerase sporulation-specific sigma factor
MNEMEVAGMPGLMTALALMLREMMVFVSYIKNNAFPQPLSEKEEEENLKLMADGDEQARNTLIEHNLRLVAHIVKII